MSSHSRFIPSTTNNPTVASLVWISNFGGDSLLAAVLFSKVIETYKIEPSLIEFYKRATIAEQTSFIDKLKKGKTGAETTQDEEKIKEKLRLLGEILYHS